VTIAKRPSVWEWDGKGYRSDLGQAKNKIFLQFPIDEAVVICGVASHYR
jgi:hypothetical protein